MVGSLTDIKILDLTHALSGPFSTMLMTELGAQVIKVEPPGGDHFRHANGGATHAVVNRNKRSLSIDLRKPESKDIMDRLIHNSDILIEAFTPGTLDRLGYSYEAVSALKPDIIYCSISGFGQTGPYRELRGYDAVAQSMSGIMASTGEANRPPVRVGPSMIDMGTGMYAVIGILDALRLRDKTGAGKRLEYNLFESALSWMSQSIARYSQTGVVPPRTGSALATFSPYQVFEAGDGQIFIGASTQKFWLRLCQGLELDDLIDDPQFRTQTDRVKNRDLLTDRLETRLREMTVEQALEKIRAAEIPCAPVLHVDGVVQDPHVEYRETIYSDTDGNGEPILQTRTPIGSHQTHDPAPALGADGPDILQELGYDAAAIKAYLDQGILLQE